MSFPRALPTMHWVLTILQLIIQLSHPHWCEIDAGTVQASRRAFSFSPDWVADWLHIGWFHYAASLVL